MAITKEIVNLVFIVFSPFSSLCLILHMDGLTCLHILEFSSFTTAVAGIKFQRWQGLSLHNVKKSKGKVKNCSYVFLLEISSLCL